MFGVDPARRTVCTHGVGISVAEISERPDGDADVVLQAGRLCELVEAGEDGASVRGEMGVVEASVATPIGGPSGGGGAA